MKKRCAWVSADPLYIEYHDKEWGRLVRDDSLLFEFLILEAFQAGLSWITILHKRENFRRAFDNFDVRKIADYDNAKLELLRQDAGIIRNRLKIEAVRNNARAFLRVQMEFGSFSNYFWDFVEGQPIVNHWKTSAEVPVNSPLSDAISKDLRKRGFKFVGSTIVYSFMQAVGIVNDHEVSCCCRKEKA